MSYTEYKENLKKLKLTSISFMKMIGMNEKTPPTNWRAKNEIPKVVELLIEALWKMSADDRVLFIYHKLEKASK